MKADRVEHYAGALLELATAAEARDRVGADVVRLLDWLDTQPGMCDFIGNPAVRVEGKRAAVEQLLRGQVHPLLPPFLLILLEAGCWPLLKPIAEAYFVRVSAAAQAAGAEVVSAQPLPAAQRGALEAALREYLGRAVILRERVDPRLVGGVVVRVGNTVLDGSVRHRLEQIREALLA
jgi:F-type H+-transporting ATPase subunit delta